MIVRYIGAWRSPASALAWGARGRRFKSSRPDTWEQSQQIPSYHQDMAVFFMSMTKTAQKCLLTSVELRDAYTDFMLSRQAMNCTPSTLEFYKYTAEKFLEWIEGRGVTDLQEVTARYVREYIAELVSLGKKDTTAPDHAQAVKTMHRWLTMTFREDIGHIPRWIIMRSLA
jgi:hypothetical protein